MARSDDTKWGPLQWVSPPVLRGDYWRVQFKPMGERVRSRSRKSEAEALTLHAILLKKVPQTVQAASIEPDGDRTLDDFDGSLRWFLYLLGKMAKELYLTRDADLRQDIKAVASAGLAAKNLFDQSEMERELEELRGWVKEIKDSWKHGTGITGPNQGTESPTQSSPPPM